MPAPSPAERDALLTAFSKALFKRDVDAIYRTATQDFVWRLPIGPNAPNAREIPASAQRAPISLCPAAPCSTP